MKIYVDVILFLNLAFDFILLFSVSTILKRNTKIFRLLLGAFVGSLTTLCLFIKMASFILFLVKLFISIIMILISFGFRNIKYFLKNILFLYINSILLGGFLYFLNIQFSYRNNGLVFFYNGLSINFILLIVISPIILYIYIKQNKILKNNYTYYHKVTIMLKNSTINCIGYLDTGNKIVDPYFRRSIILMNKKIIKNIDDFNILVPYQTVGNHGIIKCLSPNEVRIDGKNYKMLIGISEENWNIDGVDCILPNTTSEGIC